MSSEGRFDVQFNEMLNEKLGCLLELPLEEMKDGIQELRTLLRKRNEQRRLSLTDEVSMMPAEMRCMVFQNYSDFKLIDCIIANPDFESTASYVLQRRKYMAQLYVSRHEHNLKDDGELHMQCRIYKRKEVLLDDARELESWTMKKLRFSSDKLLSDYFCGFLRVILLFMTATPYGINLDAIPCEILWPEKYFGAPAADVGDKFKYKGKLIIGCGAFAPLLQWICPSSLIYKTDPKLLFDASGELTIEGVENVTIGEPTRIWNDIMEKCKAPKIQIGFDDFWSRRSFMDVLTEHASSGEDGVAGVIEIDQPPMDCTYCDAETDEEFPVGDFVGWALGVWVKRFDDWRIGHLAKYGEPGRNITYEVEEGDEEYARTFKLILH